MAEFFGMGGYAAFVWPSYAVAAVVLVGLLVATVRGVRSHEATLKALEGSHPPRRRRREPQAEGAAPDAVPMGDR